MDPVSAVIGLVTSVVSRVWPDKTETDKERFTLELTKEINESQLFTKQIDVNENEANNPSLFVAGWRPFIGWVCGLAFAWQFLCLPICLFIGQLTGHPIPVPQFDISTMTTVLMGMLGLGGMRSWEKWKGVNGNHN